MAELAVAGEGSRAGGLHAAPRHGLRPLRAFAEALAAEGDRRILWTPVFFGTGVALYFTLTIEPPLWIGVALTAGAAAAALGCAAGRRCAMAPSCSLLSLPGLR